MTRYLLGFLLIAGMASAQTCRVEWAEYHAYHDDGQPYENWSLYVDHRLTYRISRQDQYVTYSLFPTDAPRISIWNSLGAAKKEAERLACPTAQVDAPKPKQFGQWHDDGILKPAPGNLVGGRINLPITEEIHPCSATPNKDATDKARLEVMQKSLDYIAKMAARNPKEEQDAGEFLERMGRILAGSEK